MGRSSVLDLMRLRVADGGSLREVRGGTDARGGLIGGGHGKEETAGARGADECDSSSLVTAEAGERELARMRPLVQAGRRTRRSNGGLLPMPAGDGSWTSSSSAPGPPVPWSRAGWWTAAPASSCSRPAAATRTRRSTIPAGSTSSGSPRWTGRTRPCRRRTRTAAGSPGPAAGCSAARAASTRWSGCGAHPRTSTRGRIWAPTAGRGTTCDRSTSASSGASPAAPAP